MHWGFNAIDSQYDIRIPLDYCFLLRQFAARELVSQII